MALPGDPFSFRSVTNGGAKTVSELVALNGVVFARPPPVLATLSGPEKCQSPCGSVSARRRPRL